MKHAISQSNITAQFRSLERLLLSKNCIEPLPRVGRPTAAKSGRPGVIVPAGDVSRRNIYEATSADGSPRYKALSSYAMRA